MWYKLVLALISILIFFIAMDHLEGKLKFVFMLIAVLVYPAGIYSKKIKDGFEESELHDIAKKESEEQLDGVVSYYSGFDKKRAAGIRKSAVLFNDKSPFDVLNALANVVINDSPYTDFDKKRLRDLFYTTSWIESNYEKYDIFFTGDKFERRERRRNRDDVEWVKRLKENGVKYYSSEVEISFGKYDFENSSFNIVFRSSNNYVAEKNHNTRIYSGFSAEEVKLAKEYSKEHDYAKIEKASISLFNDGRERSDGAVRMGKSIASTVFPDVDQPRLRVPEKYAKDINKDNFVIFAKAYFDISDAVVKFTSNTAHFPCLFIDIYETEERNNIKKTIGCNTINKEVGRVFGNI